MNILVIGSGGREHALVWALRRSPRVEKVFCSPGNAGIAALAECVPLDTKDRDAVLGFLLARHVDLVVVGPEAPLAEGFADMVRSSGGRVFGPGKAAARLEASKVFAKEFMRASGLPTADFRVFASFDEARAFVDSPEWKPSFRVVKADGLAAGKGVTVCRDKAEVLSALKASLADKVFGPAGEKVVLEEALEGDELSVMALCDGATLSPLPSAQDHKRAFDGDRGPNTGGMGAYAPAPLADAELWARIEREVFEPFLRGLRRHELDYRGVIYFGLMLTASGPKLLEFNARFGDPETQVVVPLVENDWTELLQATVDRRLKGVTVRVRPGAAVCVVLTAEGYPGAYEKGREILGLGRDLGPDVTVFHAGTALDASGRVVTSGGRVLGVTAVGPDLGEARRRAYEAASTVSFEGAHYRQDIAARGIPAALQNR
jgi:phosphoribosylamine--glycine ligase